MSNLPKVAANEFNPEDFVTIPDGWSCKRLADCTIDGNISYGIVQPGQHVANGVPVIRVNNVNNGHLELSDVLRVSPEVEKKYERTRLKGGEVLLTLVGTTGQSFVVPNELAGWNVPRAIAVIRVCEDVGAEWVNLCLQSKNTKHFLNVRANTTVQKTLNLKDVRDIPVLIPPKEVKAEIESTVLSFSKKIELLREQNKTLETLAQTIFKEWFVHFNFPDQHGKPYRNNGGEMADSELGEIPKGWRVGKIKDFVNIFSGFAFKSKDFVEDGRYGLVTIRNVQDGSFVKDTKDRLNTLPAKMPAYCHLRTGDILLSLTGNVGRVCHVIGEDYLLNQRVAKLQAKEKNHFGYVYLFFRQPSMLNEMENISSGTAQQNLSPIKTAELDAIIPNLIDLNEFSLIVNPMVEKMLANEEQIQTLSKTRDTLLPKLMSGQVRVHSKEESGESYHE